MASVRESPDLVTEQQIRNLIEHLTKAGDVKSILNQILDVAIALTGADMGTLQIFDEEDDRLTIVAGISSGALRFFDTERRDTNSTSAIALARRVRVFREEISRSYVFVNEMRRASGIAAVQSIPLTSSSGRFCGVVSTHFRQPQAGRGLRPSAA